MPLPCPPVLAAPHRPLTQRGIEAALAYARSQGGQVLLVQEQGRTRLAHHEDPALADQPMNIMSGAKNLWTLLALQLAAEGQLDLEAPVSRYLPAWAEDGKKASIRVRHLLSCTSGLWAATRELHGPDVPDKCAYAVALPTAWPAGQRFLYAPSHFQVLGAILKDLVAPEPPIEALQRRLLRPLGLQVEGWRTDGVGQATFYAGASLRPGEWLRVGELLLDGGRWNGAPLVPAEGLARALRPSSANAAYGLSFWLNGEAHHPGSVEAEVEVWIREHPETRDWRRACLSRHAPADLFACIGSLGQRLYVIPSRRLVVVHLGRCPRFQDAVFLKRLFGG